MFKPYGFDTTAKFTLNRWLKLAQLTPPPYLNPYFCKIFTQIWG